MAAEEALEARRERLQALRLASELSAEPDGHDTEMKSEVAAEQEPDEEQEPIIKFRNYVPRDGQLQGLTMEKQQPAKFEDPVAKVPADTDGTDDPIVSIAPKKANWDVRRDVVKKLEKLERRTQRALIELMQEEEKRRQAAREEIGTDDRVD